MVKDENSSRKHSCFIDGSHYIFDTHAHYFHRRFANMPDGMDREELLKRVYESNIRKCIVPAINYWTNMEMKRLFDKPEYEWIYYAHGSHPKYLWKEVHEWNDDRWKEYEELLSNQKCIAVGETGLDYSYPEFGPTHRDVQKRYFEHFISYANKYHLPAILHIRSGIKEESIPDRGVVDADEDAISIFKVNPPKFGAVYHCFCGDVETIKRYCDVGVKYFGIGGKIFYEKELEETVRFMPEDSLVLETDAPYIRIPDVKGPNTSLSLWDIAERIAIVRGTTTEKIIELTTKNAERLFGTGYADV